MEIITNEEVMDQLDMLQYIFGKIDELVWWDLKRILVDVGTQFTSTEFQDDCQTCGVYLNLAALEHQQMNGKFKVTWRTLLTIAH